MGKCLVTSLNPAEIQLENIFIIMERFNFSKDMSATIVGGPAKLEELIASGQIYAVKGASAQNSKWKCNAAQVLRHCRNMRR
ncbi:MAG: hypothetical protein K2M59_03650 [Muribaculaceae bacterium]|nr:hypothetical protein [Muribaculaceae bacterium]MDE7465506.1 hypothetical protein [Muribaculaceae bacterium]